MKKLFLATALVFGASTVVSPFTSSVAEAKAKTEAFTKADVNLIKKGKFKHAAAALGTKTSTLKAKKGVKVDNRGTAPLYEHVYNKKLSFTYKASYIDANYDLKKFNNVQSIHATYAVKKDVSIFKKQFKRDKAHDLDYGDRKAYAYKVGEKRLLVDAGASSTTLSLFVNDEAINSYLGTGH